MESAAGVGKGGGVMRIKWRDKCREALLEVAMLEGEKAALNVLLLDVTEKLRKSQAENFALAAGQCIVDGGLCGDDYGNQYCKLQRAHDATVADAERYRWLRDVGDGETWIAFCKRNASLSTQAIDAAIDASRLGKGEK